MSNPNIFGSLDVPRHEIRLLDVLPSQNYDERIKGSLRTVSLDEPVEFEALSWCWGDAPRGTLLTVNDQDFACAPNLDAALRHFRHIIDVKTIWVDAVCINQNDLQEKSSQIVLMTRVYEGASSVRVWLGEATTGSDGAMEMMKEMLRTHRLEDHELHGVPITEEMVQSLCELLERPWWERIWVVQEVALASRAAFYCGRAFFDSAGLAEAVDGMVQTLVRSEVPFQHIKSNTIWQLSQRLFKAFVRISPLLQVLEVAKTLRKDGTPLYHTVDTIIALSRFKATEPHDKVYGCLGILPGISGLIIPDYKSYVDVVFTTVTWALIMYTRCLYSLCFVRSRRTVDIAGEEVKFPSWTLDLSQDASKRSRFFLAYSCCGEWGPFATRLRFPFLETPAVYFDEIESCLEMSSSWSINAGFVTRCRQVHGKWRSFFGLELDRSSHSAYIGAGSVEDAYWRLIAGDLHQNSERGKGYQRLRTKTIKAFPKWLRNLEHDALHPTSAHPNWETNKDMVEYHYSVQYATSGTNAHLFKTRRGYMGMASVSGTSNAIQVGDLIYFLDRGEVPWALRPSHNEVEGTVFGIAGECYIHGVMDGQAFRTPPGPDSKAWKRHELRRKLFGGQMLDMDFPLPPWTNILLT